MKDYVLITLLGLVIGALMAILGYQIESKTKEIRDKVGKEIVLNSDTLMIIDYSILNDNYKLNDGSEINISFADQLIIKTKTNE